jgi:hypothetical protein
MQKGIEITYRNGKKDWFDPVEIPDGVTEENGNYLIDNSFHVYKVLMSDVKSIRYYDLCEICGHEMFTGICHNCECDNNRNELGEQ